MRRLFTVVLALPCLTATRAQAQHVEVGPTIGYAVPLRDQFDRSVPIPTNVGFLSDQYSGRQSAAPLVGLRAALWPARLIGVELLGCLWWTRRSVDFQEGAAFGFARTSATLTSVAIRIAFRSGRSDQTQLEVSAGPLLKHFGGDAYQSPLYGVTSLRRRNVWGASGALAVMHPLSRRLGVRAALDAAFYRVQLVALPPGDTTRTPLQVELTPSVGLVYRTP